jgi:hypothetical protein
MVELDNGITYVNAPTIGAEAHMPFGGVKQTGNGHREGGWEVYEFYSETKSVTWTTRAGCSVPRSTTTTSDSSTQARCAAGEARVRFDRNAVRIRRVALSPSEGELMRPMQVRSGKRASSSQTRVRSTST